MGHRHVSNTSQMFETDSNQGWHHTEEPYVHFALAGGTENGPLLHSEENMSIDAPNFSSAWIPPSGLNRYCPSSHTVEGPNHHANTSGPSHDPYMHSSASGNFHMVPENHGHSTSSSNYSGQIFHGVQGGHADLSMGYGREAYKRKSPSIPAVHEGGSSSRYAGSSSDLSMPSELRHDKPNVEYHHTPWDYSTFRPNYIGNNFSISGEDTLRNVRSRADLVLETNLARTHLSNNPTQHSSSNAPAVEWNQTIISPAPHDATVFNHETNLCVMESGNPSASLQIGGYDNHFVTHRNTGNPLPQNMQGTISQSVQGNRTSFTHQSIPTFRPSPGYLHVAHSDEGFPLVTESYSSRHARPSSNTGWHTSDQNGQLRFSNERYRLLSYEAGVRNQVASQGLMLADRSALYGFRGSFDQHRDMRLDIDDMTYEELLALEERIGSVNTGLSEDLIKKCMTESIYCSSDNTQEEGSCAVCLEEYKNMDDVGMLKACRHDFHVGCLRKWLLLKNMCPICKSLVVADHVKEK